MQHHLDFGLCPTTSVPGTTQHYGKWTCFHPCVKGWRGRASAGSDRVILNIWNILSSKDWNRPSFWILVLFVEHQTMDKIQKKIICVVIIVKKYTTLS